MAFADPQSVTVNSVAQSLPRVGGTSTSGYFQKDDQTFRLEVIHSKSKRTRHVVRVSQRKIAADPLSSSNNVEYVQTVSLTIDTPNVGYSITEQKDLIVALADWLKASTNAATLKLVGFES